MWQVAVLTQVIIFKALQGDTRHCADVLIILLGFVLQYRPADCTLQVHYVLLELLQHIYDKEQRSKKHRKGDMLLPSKTVYKHAFFYGQICILFIK